MNKTMEIFKAVQIDETVEVKTELGGSDVTVYVSYIDPIRINELRTQVYRWKLDYWNKDVDMVSGKKYKDIPVSPEDVQELKDLKHKECQAADMTADQTRAALKAMKIPSTVAELNADKYTSMELNYWICAIALTDEKGEKSAIQVDDLKHVVGILKASTKAFTDIANAIGSMNKKQEEVEETVKNLPEQES